MRCMVSLVLALTIFSPTGIVAAGQDDNPGAEWRANAGGVSQSATVSRSEGGVNVTVQISGEGAGSAGSRGGTSPQPGRSGAPAPPVGSGGSASGSAAPAPRPGTTGTGASAAPAPNVSPPTGAAVEQPAQPLFIPVRTTRGIFPIPLSALGTQPITPPAAPVAEPQTTAWAPVGAVPQIDPWAVVQQASREVPLPSVTLRANPDPGLVAVPTWFWVTGYDGSPIRASQTTRASHTECRLVGGVAECRTVDDSVTVEVELDPTQYAWNFGDDSSTQASFGDRRGLGQAFSNPQSPSPVAHSYRTSSAPFMSAGGFQVALRLTWSARFRVNDGPWQGLPDVIQRYTARQPVREVQPVVVR